MHKKTRIDFNHPHNQPSSYERQKASARQYYRDHKGEMDASRNGRAKEKYWAMSKDERYELGKKKRIKKVNLMNIKTRHAVFNRIS